MKLMHYTYRGYTINKNQSLTAGDVTAFEFRNKGEVNVFVNGILLQPTDIHKEIQNIGEKVGDPYDVMFENIPGARLLVVIEKRYTKEG